MRHDDAQDVDRGREPIAQADAITEYVSSQWLSTTAAEDVESLMHASALTSLSASVRDRVLERHDSEQVLNRLHGQPLVLSALPRR